MTHLPALAFRSAWNRRYTLALTLFAIALACTLLLGIERLRSDARTSFAQAVSGTDLVVGARGSPLQLMLHAVFRLGEPGGEMPWASARAVAALPDVAWTIPLALGDSHRGFPVVGTTGDYFTHFRYGSGEPLRLAAGAPFTGLFDAVLGADIAERLGYRVGDRIVLSHGSGHIEGLAHDDKPFTVTGILARTGTPVDRSVHVGLEAIAAIHLEWQGGAPMPGVRIPAEFVRKFDLAPKTVSALLVGLKQRGAVFAVQRQIAGMPGEPLTGVLPGVALDELWQLTAVAENALLLVSACVVAVGLAGLAAVILAGLEQRRRELAILRSVGARPRDIFLLLAGESLVVTLAGALAGIVLHAGLRLVLSPWLQAQYGIGTAPLSTTLALAPGEWRLLAGVLAAGGLASLLPGYRAYRLSLADGLTPRI